jgi:multiple sugar transport system permease protein
MMLPEQVTLIPTYLLWSKLGLIDAVWPLVLPSWLGRCSSSSCSART